MRLGKTQPERVIDLKHIQAIDFMELGADGLRIGALYRVRDAEMSEPLRRSPYGVLSHAAGTLGSPQVRNKATIVGNVCRCSPSADLIPPLIALNARARIRTDGTATDRGRRGHAARSREDHAETGRDRNRIGYPRMRLHSGCGYYKLSPRKSLDLAVVGVAVMVRTNPQVSKCVEARIVLGAVAPTAMRAKKAESMLDRCEPEPVGH